jgi:8-oxo-dGTP pyrophosphatase MutT (NUDIX family)
MKLLATIKPEDVDADVPSFDYGTFTPRTAARAIVFDGEKVALIHIIEHGYYMLPGGGTDGDDLQTGLAREILEELGCEVEITGEVGSTEVYIDRWRQKQTDIVIRLGK